MLLVLEKGTSVLFPNFCLLGINFPVLNLFFIFLFHLPSKIVSHLCFLFLSYLLTSFLFILFFSKLIVDMPYHFLIFSSDLLFLVFDNRIGKWGHYCLDLFLAFSFLLLSFSLKLILKSSVLLLRFDILNKWKCTSILYFSASSLSLRWFY